MLWLTKGMCEMNLYILKSKQTGKWIAIDSHSGYPAEVDEMDRAHQWRSKSEANAYNAVMSWKDYDNPLYELHRLTLFTQRIEQPTAEDLRRSRDG